MTDIMTLPLFLGGIGWGEILVVALVILLFFGGKKIPELMRGLGKGVRSFKEGMNDMEKEIRSPDESAPKNEERQEKTGGNSGEEEKK